MDMKQERQAEESVQRVSEMDYIIMRREDLERILHRKFRRWRTDSVGEVQALSCVLYEFISHVGHDAEDYLNPDTLERAVSGFVKGVGIAEAYAVREDGGMGTAGSAANYDNGNGEGAGER